MYSSVLESLRNGSDGEEYTLKGDTPFSALVESIYDQFQEFKATGYVTSDTTNYMDSMNDAIAISDQINATNIEEYQIDDGSLQKMKELFTNVTLDLMNDLGVDLSQVPENNDLLYILYTNFILTSQRQLFFNYGINRMVKSDSLEYKIAIAHGKMLENDPKDMYHIVKQASGDEMANILPFTRDSGFSDIQQWIDNGYLPESVMMEVFLNGKESFDMMFTNYFQSEKEKLQGT